jgi:hypothetical protein
VEWFKACRSDFGSFYGSVELDLGELFDGVSRERRSCAVRIQTGDGELIAGVSRGKVLRRANSGV